MMVLMPFAGLQAQKVVKLQHPSEDRGISVMEALAIRHSVREFSAKALSDEDLSDLLWAANGVSRSDGRRTAPSAMNKQDIDLYVVMDKGAYRYDAKNHLLVLVAEGDHRAAVAATQAFVKTAPVSIVMVADLSKWGKVTEETLMLSAIDAGVISENINLFCAAVGLNTVPRVNMNREKLGEVLKLKPTQRPIMNNPVGYSK